LYFLNTGASNYPTDWSPDGDLIVHHSASKETKYDVWAAPVRHPNQRRALVQTKHDDVQGQISPSGRWLAYTSNQSSRYEVWVQSLPDGPHSQVSIDGGSDPEWRADEKELFFLGSDGRMMSVDWSGAASFDRAMPRALFQFRALPVMSPFLSAYDVDRAGQRFLVRNSKESLETQPLNVIMHWSVPGQDSK
jgi:hypothetical protein